MYETSCIPSVKDNYALFFSFFDEFEIKETVIRAFGDVIGYLFSLNGRDFQFPFPRLLIFPENLKGDGNFLQEIFLGVRTK